MSVVGEEPPFSVRLNTLKDLLKRALGEESGQDIFEYVLVGAGVGVVIASILIVGFGFIVPELLGNLCSTVDPLGGGDCLP